MLFIGFIWCMLKISSSEDLNDRHFATILLDDLDCVNTTTDPFANCFNDKETI